jgi:uncharacterized protein YcgI (DUF1989 family)
MSEEYGECRYDITLQPISGKAVPMYPGEVMRITQLGGEQCVDFNCFNLHDYKERMSVGHMRVQGFRPKQGHIVVSTPPRYRPMMVVHYMSDTNVTDLLGARCDATAGEREYGIVPRTNCQDTLGEAIREFGLTPDDVHDSFNMWMHTVWNASETNSFFPIRNVGPKGDYVDLMALMDVLAVPITCGSGDLGQISNFGFKPLQVQVFEASDSTMATVRSYLDRCTGFKNQRSRDDFKVKEILKERKLKKVEGYEPQFRAFPIETTDIEVPFTAKERSALKAMRGKMGKTDEAVARAAFMLWYQANRMKPHWIAPAGPGCQCCPPMRPKAPSPTP